VSPQPVPDELMMATETASSESARSARAGGRARSAPVPDVPGNLPAPLTDLIGRRRELALVADALAAHRLVTLVGPGGCGKTRLALAAGRRSRAEFPDGVWWVELSALTDGSFVVSQLASALRVRETAGRALRDSLTRRIAGRRLLLVLDNCEHVLESCAAAVIDLLAACPRVSVLTTSREPLGVAGESLLPLLGLRVPERLPAQGAAERLEPEGIADVEAVRLFVERARAVQPAFTLTADNAAAVVEICGRLGGMPLAIELAAARAPVLSAPQLAARLDDALTVLGGSARRSGPARQQTLRATLDWSYRLLPPAERQLLRRLTVFHGGFSLPAAEAVGALGDVRSSDVLDLLSRLVDKSLVQPDTAGDGPRFSLLETVRQFGQERLGASGELDAVAHRHASFYLSFAERAEADLSGPAQARALEQLETEQDNVRAALRWSRMGGDRELGLRLAAALWRFCSLRGRYGEGRDWLESAIESAAQSAANIPVHARGKALTGAGVLALLQSDYAVATARLEQSLQLHRGERDRVGTAQALQTLGSVARELGHYQRARALHEESLALWRELGDATGVARALNYLGFIAWLDGDNERAEESSGQALQRFRALGDEEGISSALIMLGAAAGGRGDHDRAQTLLEDSRALSLRLGYQENVAWSLHLLGALACRRGQLARASALLRESLALHSELGDRWRVASVLEDLAGAIVAVIDPERAGQLFGAAQALREETGTPRPPCEEADYRTRLAGVQRALSVAQWQASWAAGRGMGLEEAVRTALAAAVAVERPERTPSATGRLPAVAGGQPPTEIRVFALGAARVERSGHVVASAEWGYAKPRELLYYLLDAPESSKEQIGLALWPAASPEQLRNTLHTALHHLRRALGDPGWVSYRRGRYAVDRGRGLGYDVDDFDSRLAAAATATGSAAIRLLRSAVDLYSGDFLADLQVGEWALARRAQLRRAFEQALLALGRLLTADHRAADAVEVFHRLLAQDPLLEVGHRELMRAYMLLGERGRALRQYDVLVDLLADELRSAPSAETTGLYQQVRRGR
jgi:predicted ATPase/DNA-binding SARP family transcriptional activator